MRAARAVATSIASGAMTAPHGGSQQISHLPTTLGFDILALKLRALSSHPVGVNKFPPSIVNVPGVGQYDNNNNDNNRSNTNNGNNKFMPLLLLVL